MIPILQGKDRDYLMQVQSEGEVERTLLISDSYRQPYKTPEQLSGAPDMRYQLQDELVRFLEENPDRFLGICSIDVTWPDVQRFVDACTDVKSIKGVKIHFRKDHLLLQNPAINTAFLKVLEALKHKPIFYLIHFDFEENALEEAKRIFEVARRFQKQNFIIAHGAERHSEVLDHLGTQFASRPELRHNVYTDVSTVFTIGDFFQNDRERVVQNWKAFGMKHLLFGSDFPISTPGVVLRELNKSGLAPREIEGIKTSNALDFFATLD